MMLSPSAIAAIIPYSIPLWTIFTKWPAPFGPQCRYPSVAVPSVRVRPGVGSAIPAPGAIVLNTGSRRRDRFVLTADHQAEAPFEPEHTARRADVDVVDLLRRERLRPCEVVAVVRVATVDHRVVGLEERDELVECRLHDCRGQHEPEVPRCVELGDEVGEGRCADGTFGLEVLHRELVDVEDDATVTVAHQAPDEVRTHAPEADHAELRRPVGGHGRGSVVIGETPRESGATSAAPTMPASLCNCAGTISVRRSM